MLERLWSNGDSYLLLIGTQAVTATLEDTFAISYKTKHTLTVCPHENLHTEVYGSFLHNYPLESTKMSFCRYMDK